MYKKLRRLIELLDSKRKLELIGLTLLIVLTSCVEVLSIGAVLPFLSVLFSDGPRNEYFYLQNYFYLLL